MKRGVVAVVGGGLAGLACALAAAQAGAAVTLFEERADVGGPPAHVDVVPNMLRDLVRLGVGDACVRAGFPYRRTSAIGQRGTPLYSLEAERLAGARYPAAIGITQSGLCEVLADAARAAGVQVRCGSPVADLQAAPAGGADIVLAGGDRVHADLALLACGAHAALRERVFQVRPDAADTEWFYFVARRPRGLDDALQASTGNGDRAHVVPVSGSLAGVRLAPRSPHAELRADGASRMLARFPGLVGELAAHIEPGTPFVCRSGAASLLPQPWTRGPVLAVGDCAHALPPHFGQSAAQAMEDAVVLGELLAHGDVSTLPKTFVQRRGVRVQQVTAIVTQAARWDAAPDRDTDLLHLSRALAQLVHLPA